jgi:hypothetical protein
MFSIKLALPLLLFVSIVVESTVFGQTEDCYVLNVTKIITTHSPNSPKKTMVLGGRDVSYSSMEKCLSFFNHNYTKGTSSRFWGKYGTETTTSIKYLCVSCDIVYGEPLTPQGNKPSLSNSVQVGSALGQSQTEDSDDCSSKESNKQKLKEELSKQDGNSSVKNFLRDAKESVSLVPCGIYLEGVGCAGGNCHFNWSSKDESGEKIPVKEEDKIRVQSFYNDVKRKALERKREELLRAEQFEALKEVTAELIELLKKDKKLPPLSQEPLRDGQNVNFNRTTQEAQQSDFDNNGVNEVSKHVDGNGKEFLLIDINEDGFPDTKVTFGQDGRPQYEDIERYYSIGEKNLVIDAIDRPLNNYEWFTTDRNKWEREAEKDNFSFHDGSDNSFINAAYNNTKEVQADAYINIDQRQDYYELVGFIIANDSKIPPSIGESKFFEAASIVTDWQGVGFTETLPGKMLFSDATNNTLSEINEDLFESNMQVINKMLFEWEKPYHPNPNYSSVTLSGFDFDLNMIEYEQNIIENYFVQNPTSLTPTVTEEINGSLNPGVSSIGYNGIQLSAFEWAKEASGVNSLDFTNYNQRVAIGKAMIFQLHNKTLNDYLDYMRR